MSADIYKCYLKEIDFQSFKLDKLSGFLVFLFLFLELYAFLKNKKQTKVPTFSVE